MAVQSTNTSKQTIRDLKRYEPRSLHHEVPVVWELAKGYYVWDTQKRRYLDFTSGIFVANTGHNPPAVRKAIVDQSRKLLHSYVFPNQPRIELVKKLVEMTGMDKVFLCSTGAEAVEAAIRCITAYRPSGDIFCLPQGNHGRTQGCRSLNRMTLSYLNEWQPPKAAGIVVETYYGYNAEFHPNNEIQFLRNWTQGKGVILCFDEIQAGFGRTGRLFGYEHYGVKPDLICVGKGLGGGLPISAVIGRADLLDAPDDLSSTHTGNPVCCAAALANLDILERDKLVKLAEETGHFVRQMLIKTFPEYQITGKGMVWGIDLKDIALANLVVDLCSQRGLLLVKTHRGTIKIGAPLITPPSEMKRGIKVIREVLDKCLSGILE